MHLTNALGTIHTVDFSETDAAGVVHFSNFFRYMEKAERQFFAAAGVPLFSSDPSAMSGFPRVEAWCRYRAPLRFGESVRITPTLRQMRASSLRFEFAIHRWPGESEAAAPVLLAEGGFVTVHSVRNATGGFEARLIPDDWRQAFTPFVKEA